MRKTSNDIVSSLSQYKSYTDIEIIKLYRQSKETIYISVMLYRYEHLILKIISQWHRMHKHNVYLLPGDFEDVLHTAYCSVIYCFNRVKEPDRIKNVGSRIKQYIYNALNKVYLYRSKECTTEDIITTSNKLQDPTVNDKLMVSLLGKYADLYYYTYHHRYDYYKMALLMTNAKQRKYMKTKVQRIKDRLILSVRRNKAFGKGSE